MDSEPEIYNSCMNTAAGGLVQAAELLRKKVLQPQDLQSWNDTVIIGAF